MKKLIILSLLVGFVLSSLAFPNIIYRCRFRPLNGSPCWNQGRVYRDGPNSDYDIMDPSGAVTYTVPPGSCIEIDMKSSCCGGTPQMGYTWEESSSDGGQSWQLVSPTFTNVIQPLGYLTVEWDNETGFFGHPGLVHSCP
jgi:hypothetical protein